jgi:hypothetical protein
MIGSQLPPAASVGRGPELEEVLMSIVGGFDIHRQQITFDYVDTITGEVKRGQIGHADRHRFAAWLRRFEGREDVEFAVEGCTGWRYVVEEMVRAGITPHLAEPASRRSFGPVGSTPVPTRSRPALARERTRQKIMELRGGKPFPPEAIAWARKALGVEDDATQQG